MELINSIQISDYIGNEVVFKIGQDNFNNGIIILEFIGKYLVRSKVNGHCNDNKNNFNRVIIEFKLDGGIKKSKCSCMEFEFTSPCSHVVATCLETINYIKDHPNRTITNTTLVQEFKYTKSDEIKEVLKDLLISNPLLFTNINLNNNIDDDNIINNNNNGSNSNKPNLVI